MLIPTTIPNLIPGGAPSVSSSSPTSDPFSLYDIAIGGIGFDYANSPDSPMVRETAPLEKDRVDQAATPGEQTLTSWWIKSQDSWHGGAGQLQLEPAFPTPVDHVRYDLSKNVEVFMPGQVTRLPDTTVLTADSTLQVVGVAVSGVDAVAYLTSAGAVRLLGTLTGSVTQSNFSGATSGILSIATDGRWVYAASATHIYKLDPLSLATTVTVATFTSATNVVLGWVKARLMLGADNSVYEVDVTQTAVALSATQLRYSHPTSTFAWRCFGTSPSAILAAGDAFGVSTITQFTLDTSGGIAPLVIVGGEVSGLPVGERVLSLLSSQGTLLAIGTTKGVRLGTYNTYTGALNYGALTLTANSPVIPAVALATRDRFVYAAGLAYDEGGLIRIDTGTHTDETAGRFAWAPDLIAPTTTATAATSVATLPVSGSLVFSIPGTGVLLEGTVPGVVREAWLRTSRIRYNTTEPKLYKLGRIRGTFLTGSIGVAGSTPGVTQNLITVGGTADDPDEFRLIDGLAEWLTLTLTLHGDDVKLTSYGVKALPGTRRQLQLQFVVSIADSETKRNGQRQRDTLSSRARLNALEAIALGGDETTLQEFTPSGVVNTRVIVERVSFKQTARPSTRSDIGGTAEILLRTVES